MNHFLLHLLARAVGPRLCGRRIGGVRLLPPVLSIEFSGEGPGLHGAVILSAPGPFFYFDTADPTGGLGMEVLRRIRGLAVTRVEVPDDDRVLRFILSGPREELTLSATLFGSMSRVRVEGPETVVESLDPRENGKPLPAGGVRRVTGRAPSLATALEADLARVPGLAEPPERAISGLTHELLDAFSLPGGFDAPGLLRFRDGLVRASAPFFLATRRRAGSACPVPAPPCAVAGEAAFVLGPFDDAEPACREAGRVILASLRGTLVERSAAPLKKHLSARRRLLARLEGEKLEAESFAALRQEANVLASYRSRVPPGARAVTLPDLYGSGELTIPLDPSAPLQEQIDKRYRLAAKLERKRSVIRARASAIAQEIARLEEELAAAESETALPEAISRIESAKRRRGFEEVPARKQPVKPKSRELRRLDLDADWFAIVGRSERENDEITFRIAGPDDIWLHAQHAAGSHVILKSRGTRANPPAAVLEAAAGIAAHYSKARRASVVPVVYTRRKYVRKFKGAKPGQVICEREKTILAEPKLPEPAGG